MRSPKRNPRYTGRLLGMPDRRLTRACPKCSAAIGWRCVAKVGSQYIQLKSVHPEREGKI